jgi:hypothetical protein
MVLECLPFSTFPKGTYVFGDDDHEIIWVDKKLVETLPDPIKHLYYEFAIIKREKYGAPETFNGLTIAWYVNHAETPNLASDSEYRFYALRDISAGEELTVDYRTYSELPVGSV